MKVKCRRMGGCVNALHYIAQTLRAPEGMDRQ